ncbi:MAG: hypothetical protein ABS75_32295 [Pelagibacterium sp. SCN 63-23]|nr:MAG: hypothetical protein ABS75_32295 [Pelagibacterium sp. SCN 63-23]
MSDTLSWRDTTGSVVAKQRGLAYLRALAGKALLASVWLWIFSGGIILFEPSFYELLFIVTLALALAAGMRLYATMTPLLLLAVPFAAFGLIAAFQVRYTPLTDSFIFVAVTIFLLVTTYFVANFVAEDPHRRMKLIRQAYIAIAAISATIGLLAYLRLMPAADMFLRYDRAKGMFKDPNVYGPFLVLPAMFLLRDLFFQRRKRLFAGAIFMLLMVGVFVSFSRAAWGHFAGSTMLVFGLCFWLEARARDKVRMLIFALVGGMVVLVSFAGLLSVPAIGSLFEARASVTQDYDTGETGRFGRQGYAFDLALSHPWGMGPTEFGHLRIREQPHNTYVTVIQAYGWGGGLCYYLLVLATLWRGIAGLRDRERRGLLIPVLAVYVPLAIQSGLIDTDHWRHYFLVVGLVWGLTAGTTRPATVPSSDPV